MKCKECLALIDDFLEGELDEPTATLLASHLAVCCSCAQEQQQILREQKAYADYQRDIQLAPALWAGVRKRIENERSSLPSRRSTQLSEWFPGFFLAARLTPALTIALVLFAIGITVAVMKYVISPGQPLGPVMVQESPQRKGEHSAPDSSRLVEASQQDPAQQESSQAASKQTSQTKGSGMTRTAQTEQLQSVNPRPEASHKPTVEELVRDAEQKYLAAITLLSGDVKRRGSKLDPELRKQFEKTLVTIDRTIAETRQAVHQRPSDPEAVQYMLTAYAKKVEVLQEMASY